MTPYLLGQPHLLGDVSDSSIAWATAKYYGTGYAGSWLGGAGVGYVVARTGKGAATGGLAASGFWCLVEGLYGIRTNTGISVGLLGVSALSLFLAWRRR
jgi:hypothetical protein